MANSTFHPPLSGSALLNDPALNKGTAFTAAEREARSLEGLLPARIETIGEQIEPIVRSMAAATDRPIILPLSNPTSRAEATPTELLSWTEGRALVATGSPLDDVVHDGVTHHISQANNVYVFPGLGLGARVANVSQITDSMLLAAATGVAEQSPCRTGEATAGVLLPLDEVQTVSRRIAFAVARAAAGDQIDDDEIHRRIDQFWWTAAYVPVHPEPEENQQ